MADVPKSRTKGEQAEGWFTISPKMITEMRGADLFVFDLKKSVIFVILCGRNVFELIKTVMVKKNLARIFL